MNSNIIFIVTITCMVLISSCYSMNMFATNDDSLDMFHPGSNYVNVTVDVVERSVRKHCVKCKFHLFDCCEPDICVKKTLRPDKCLSIKQGK